MSRKRIRSLSQPTALELYKSSPIEDRSSKFVAVFSPTLSAKPLQQLPEFGSATHRIAAWRKPGNQRSLGSQPILETGHDDDGEKYGGKMLEKELVTRNIEGALVVARWYGGVMLGPARFDHMRVCANNAISRWVRENEHNAKRAKFEAEDAEKHRLIEILPQRDESIAVLRELLATKTQLPTSSQGDAKSPAARVQDYSTLALVVLQRLEHVKDKTIGWILERIENAERAEAESSARASPQTIC